jgi:uncharacterized protein
MPLPCGQGGKEVALSDAFQIQLQDLPDAGWHWQGQINASLLRDVARGEVEALPSSFSDLQWDASLHRVGDCYHLSGEWCVEAVQSCSRCNAPYKLTLSDTLTRDFRLGEEDADEVLPPPGFIDLVDILREDVWLSWPQAGICRPDCKGLCLHCGQNLNQASCACPADDSDHPFAVLKKIKLQAHN